MPEYDYEKMKKEADEAPAEEPAKEAKTDAV